MSKKPILTAAEAASWVEDGVTISTSGFVASQMPEALNKALEQRFLETGSPKNLTLFYAAAQGNRDGSGADHFAHEGMLKRVVGGHYNMVPELGKLIIANKLEAYNLPQGTLSQLFRDVAAHKLGTLTHVGLNTFADPRIEGGKLNSVTTEDIVEVVEVLGQERLLYKAIPVDIAFIRGSIADENGNVTLEHECCTNEATSIAQAAKNAQTTQAVEFTGDSSALKLNVAYGAAHGTKCFTEAYAVVKDDTIIAAYVDEFQFVDSAAGLNVVPNSDVADGFAAGYAEGKALAFAHGFNIRYQQIVPPAGVDVFMAAPKGPGHTVRSTYVAGKGVPCLVAVEQDATGHAYQTALAYIAGIGGARAGVMETTFHDETETDLFGEQTVLCGGVVDLMRCGFEVLVEAGYEPENAYFECIHEMKLIIDLINKGGVAAMNYSISDTAEFGEYVSGPRVIPHEETKARMRAVLADIQDGTFAGKWIAENKNGRTFFNSKRAQLKKHQMEIVGGELRKNMIWGGDSDLDTASN